ncbi:putative multiple sugar transport system substrate-binding protein [Microcella putealis]|uniref:Putative multiple sugar transport system substrate-binding protein n=1 Tax=Microcella putealis TaxID=337005 RepID=A0A4Q7LN07_9MICO|nr:putative multiple sugar transport system substrate-binding protein [Microcella putealis]TQM19634.1 putative multiple sugar transport system substrate-binding protein [Microcella putealis]
MKNRKFLLSIAAAGVMSLALAGCAGDRTGGSTGGDAGGDDAAGGIVGVAMPTQQSERWIADGANVEEQLEALGYDVDLQFANDDIPTQVAQIENMITSGAEALIIASIDGTTLTDVLQQAADAGIPVIAYDRLINGSENVDYYTTFDNFQVGVQQATSLLIGMGVFDENGERTDVAGPLNVELFAGSPDDNNAGFFFNGAMSVIQPLIDDGTLVVPSGQTAFEQVAILRWLPETAQERMENILTIIGDTQIDGVLSPYDGLSIGIISALTSGGYSTDALPVITGQDAEVGSVQSIIAGEQYSTIFKDTRLLAEQAVAMVDALLSGGEPEVNDTETYDNGVKVVPSYLLESTIVTIDNYEEVLIGSGYYTAEDLG